MLPKKDRADTKAVEKVFKEGKFLGSPTLFLRYLRNDDKGVKISFIAPKSVAKMAIERNLLRRRGYTALKKLISQFPVGFIGVFVFKKYQNSIFILENEIKKMLVKIN